LKAGSEFSGWECGNGRGFEVFGRDLKDLKDLNDPIRGWLMGDVQFIGVPFVC
jgi:hypothetical protein